MSGHKQSARMAWALSSAVGRIVHVGELSKELNGLKCGCVCPSCKGTLQAVNVDKADSHFKKPNTRGKFFRHDSGQQTNGCAVIAARMAALSLLYEHDSIDLPAPSRQVSVYGASGHQYAGIAKGKRLRLKVRYREWVDEQTARLTTDDGRIIQIQLSSVTQVSSDGVHGVIEVRVNDPEVSSWTPQQILERATLDGGPMCWIRHWDDQALTDAARRDAEAQAADNSDFIPPELAHLVGQATSLISESVLHWAVKEILAQAQSVKSPTYAEQITSTYPSRMAKDRMLYWRSETLKLNGARLEQHVGNVVPDIRCQAQDSSGNTFDLFVEVVVTNSVTEQKLARIRKIGSACLVIDLKRLRISGRVKREKLRQAVLEETDLKKWLFHPLIDAKRLAVLTSLNNEIQQQEFRERKMEERDEKLRSMSDENLAREFVLALQRRWSDTDSRLESWTTGELATSLTDRGYTALSQNVLVSEHGLLWHLETVCLKQSLRAQITDIDPYELFSMAMRDISLREYISLLIRAIKKYRPAMTPKQRDLLTQSFAVIRRSIDIGELTYARPNTYDSLISVVYPALAKDIADPVGTKGHARKIQKELAEKRQKDELAAQQAHAQELKTQQIAAAQIAAKKAEQDYRATYEELTSHMWNQDRGSTRYSEQAQLNVKFLKSRKNKKFVFDKNELVDSAWKARERGQPFADWLAMQEPKTAANLHDYKECLVAACLVL